MAVFARAFISGLTAVSVTLTTSVPGYSIAPMSRADYEACQASDEQTFRTAIEAITVKALNAGVANLDYPAIVAEEWRKGGVDSIVNARVDVAIAEVRDESSWASLIQSLASSEKAKELATAVADRTYRSDAVKAAIEGVAAGVGVQVGNRLEFAAQDAAEPALTCLQAFLGPRYGATVARIVGADAGKEFGIDPSKGGIDISSGDVLRQSGAGLTGAAILIARRSLANMAQRIGQRLAGSILSRLVSVVAGGVGLVLIAKDIWQLRNGVLPIIADEMKSAANKEMVQAELAKAISEQIGEHVKEIGVKSADRVMEIWQDFRRAHAKVLEISERSEPFKAYLNSVNPDQLPRLDEVVALVLAAEGEPGVTKRLADGTLNEAVSRLPAAGMEIARQTRSIETALKWQAIAGSDLDKIVEYEIHLRSRPGDFTKASLQRVLAAGDRLAIIRLSSVNRETRDSLFELDNGDLIKLTRSLTEAELSTLARYLTGLGQTPRERVLRAIAAQPAKMQVLASERVRDAVLASEDQLAAVSMMLRTDAAINPATVTEDFRLAWDGRVSPILLWDKHPIVIALGLLAALFLFLLLRRLLFPRRRTIAAQA